MKDMAFQAWLNLLPHVSEHPSYNNFIQNLGLSDNDDNISSSGPSSKEIDQAQAIEERFMKMKFGDSSELIPTGNNFIEVSQDHEEVDQEEKPEETELIKQSLSKNLL